MFNVPS